MAFEPKSDIKFMLYYVGFPKEWKEQLIKIQRAFNPNWKDEYGIATYGLKKSLDAWLDGVISMKSLSINSNDERWLVSCDKEIDIDRLFQLIRIWVASYFANGCKEDKKKNVEPLVKEFLDNMDISSLQSLAGCCQEVLFSAENKLGEDYSYTALPLIAVNRFIGKSLIINGREIKFNYAGKNHLISDIQGKWKNIFSYGIEFTLQTTPPERNPIFLCNTVIHRWIPSNYKPPYFREKINAHIWGEDSRIYKLPICYGYNREEERGFYFWDKVEENCYNLYNYHNLPNATGLLENISDYISKNKVKITLPYKNGMDKYGFNTNKIGVGVSVVDKHSIYEGVYDKISDIVDKCVEVERFDNKNIIVNEITLAEKDLTFEKNNEFANRFAECLNDNEFNLEIYYANDLEEYADVVLNQARESFVSNENITFNISKKPLGFMGEELENDKKKGALKRIEEIKDNIEPTDEIIGCIILLPGKESFKSCDPKSAIRCGFAHTNRLTQFITPWLEDKDEKEDEQGNKDEKHKISSAFEDLVRQFGFLMPIKKDTKLIDVPAIAMHTMTQLNCVNGKARYLPIFVIVDYKKGSVTVECDALSRINIPYREAGIELAKLSLDEDFSEKCNNASRNMFKQKMKKWKSLYKNKDALVLIESNGNTRAICPEISDSSISKYEYNKLYCPKEINIGTKENSYMESFENSKLRLLRIRCNGEVPDYFTNRSTEGKYVATSGIFKYNNDFWAIAPKPKDNAYNKSYYKTKSSNPLQKFAECHMIEIYPIMLQNEDEAIDWVRYTNAMRNRHIQYDNLTVKPMALHLAQKLEEYILQLK